MGEHSLLVVDDDADVRNALKDALLDENYDVEVASDGLKALDHLRERPAPSAIILDLMMPRGDGIFLLQQMKRDPRIADIPVVILTAERNVERRLASSAVKCVLSKPVELATLVSAIKNACTSTANSLVAPPTKDIVAAIGGGADKY